MTTSSKPGAAPLITIERERTNNSNLLPGNVAVRIANIAHHTQINESIWMLGSNYCCFARFFAFLLTSSFLALLESKNFLIVSVLTRIK